MTWTRPLPTWLTTRRARHNQSWFSHLVVHNVVTCNLKFGTPWCIEILFSKRTSNRWNVDGDGFNYNTLFVHLGKDVGSIVQHLYS